MTNFLEKYGFDKFFQKQIEQENYNKIAKVVLCTKTDYKIIVNNVEKTATLKFSIYYKNQMLPKVGDFVIFDYQKEYDTYVITSILDRKTILKRKQVGKKDIEQIIVVNIDYAFITLPLDEQFNIKKIERIITTCKDANIIPIILVTKSDLSTSISTIYKELQDYFTNITIILTTIYNPKSIEEICQILAPNKTGVFIGSSGAGKSTLTNLILGLNKQKVASVSNKKNKGKHTTTHRELFLLSGGGCIIDTPGVKEFALWLNDESAIEDTFKDIQILEKQCKFTNCSHINEQGCAVLDALEKNLISEERYNNYIKLKAENEVNFGKISKAAKEQKMKDKSGKGKAKLRLEKKSNKHKGY